MSEEVKTKNAFQKFTEKYAQLWQIIKFLLASMVAGASEYIVYICLSMFILTPLAAQGMDWFVFHYQAGTGSTSGLCQMVAYLVSTTVGNMVSFVINRKKTFNTATNVTFSVTATLIMIACIICVSTYVGPILTTTVNGWFANVAMNAGFKDFLVSTIGKCIICTITAVVVFLLDKFVILREPHKTKEQKELEKKAAEEEALKPTKKVVNKALAHKFLIVTIILAVLAVAGILVGRIAAINALLIAGSIFAGIAIICLVAFVVEALGDNVPLEENEVIA